MDHLPYINPWSGRPLMILWFMTASITYVSHSSYCFDLLWKMAVFLIYINKSTYINGKSMTLPGSSTVNKIWTSRNKNQPKVTENDTRQKVALVPKNGGSAYITGIHCKCVDGKQMVPRIIPSRMLSGLALFYWVGGGAPPPPPSKKSPPSNLQKWSQWANSENFRPVGPQKVSLFRPTGQKITCLPPMGPMNPLFDPWIFESTENYAFFGEKSASLQLGFAPPQDWGGGSSPSHPKKAENEASGVHIIAGITGFKHHCALTTRIVIRVFFRWAKYVYNLRFCIWQKYLTPAPIKNT